MYAASFEEIIREASDLAHEMYADDIELSFDDAYEMALESLIASSLDGVIEAWGGQNAPTVYFDRSTPDAPWVVGNRRYATAGHASTAAPYAMASAH